MASSRPPPRTRASRAASRSASSSNGWSRDSRTSSAGPGWSRLLLVGHGGTNRAILSWMARGGLEVLASFEQDEGCLNVLDVDLEGGEVLRRYVRVMNLTPYNLTKEDLYMTTLERIVADRNQRRC